MAERRQQFTDPALERALRAVGTEIAYPPTPDLAATVRQRLAAQPARPRPWWLPTSAARRRLGLALALLLVIALAIGALPPVRKGVARRLGLSNVEIIAVTAVPTPAPSPTAPPATPVTDAAPPVITPASAVTATPTPDTASARAGLGTRTTRADAQTLVPFTIRAPGLPEFSTPNEVYVGQPPPGGRASLVYRSRADLPGIAGTDIGLLLQEFRGGIDAGFFGKGVPPGARVEPMTINGAQGYWIEGGLRFFVYRDASGVFQTENTRIAGNTLLWEQGGVVYRLESLLPKEAAVRIAASVR